MNEEMATWPWNRCVARAVSREGSPRCDLKKAHDGDHRADRAMYWVAWSRGTWLE